MTTRYDWLRPAGVYRAHFPKAPDELPKDGDIVHVVHTDEKFRLVANDDDSSFSLVLQQPCATCGTCVDPGAVCPVCEQAVSVGEKGASS